MYFKKQQLEPFMEQWACSKLEKEYNKAIYFHPAYLTSMQSACMHAKSLQLCLTLQHYGHVVRQFPLSMEISRQGYRSGLSCPFPRDNTNPGVEPESLKSPAFSDMFFTTSTTWEALLCRVYHAKCRAG